MFVVCDRAFPVAVAPVSICNENHQLTAAVSARDKSTSLLPVITWTLIIQLRMTVLTFSANQGRLFPLDTLRMRPPL